MKKTILIIICLILGMTAVPLFTNANQEDSFPDNPGMYSQNEDTDDHSEEPESCICGRAYFTEDGNGYSKYDCIKCHKNIHECTCKCWCGADSISAFGSLYCKKCGKECSNCTCSENKTELLEQEAKVLLGLESGMYMGVPQSGWPVLIIIIIVFSGVGILLYLEISGKLNVPEKKRKKKEIKQEPIQETSSIVEKEPVDTIEQNKEYGPEYETEPESPEEEPELTSDEPATTLFTPVTKTIENIPEEDEQGAGGESIKAWAKILLSAKKKEIQPVDTLLASEIMDGMKVGDVEFIKEWCNEILGEEED